MEGRDNHEAETSMALAEERTKRLIEFTWGKKGSKFFIHTYSQRARHFRLYPTPANCNS